jgi:hypothetical protein
MAKIRNTKFGHCDFEFVWDLGFRAWDLRKKEVMKWQTR